VSEVPPRDWQATAASATTADVAQLLTAFPRPGQAKQAPPGLVGGPAGAELAALHGWVARAAPLLPARIRDTLSGEVDPGQAALFARRYAAVDALLVSLDAPSAAVLRAGLVCRTAEVLADSGPRALRVRAVADFYYSQGARVQHVAHHRARPLSELVAETRWRRVAPGVEHAPLVGTGPAGPVAANALRIVGRRLRALDLRGEGSLSDAVRRFGAVAGTSGGFFLYSEPDIAPPNRRTDPVGLLVSDGEVVGMPWFRRAALVQRDDGRLSIERIGPEGSTIRLGDRSWTVGARNAPEAVGRTAVLFTRAFGDAAPAPGLRLAGDRALGRGAAIPLLGGVLVAPGADGEGRIRWSLPDPTIRDAVAGGPLMFGGSDAMDLGVEDFRGSAPPVTFSRDETYDQNLLPRLAAGLSGDALLVVAVDGRDLHRSPGFTLRMTADLLRALGCTVAVNLDGGSSKRMIVGDRQVDLASTEVRTSEAAPQRIRPVHSALVFG
jgi:hypothetical protein